MAISVFKKSANNYLEPNRAVDHLCRSSSLSSMFIEILYLYHLVLSPQLGMVTRICGLNLDNTVWASSTVGTLFWHLERWSLHKVKQPALCSGNQNTSHNSYMDLIFDLLSYVSDLVTAESLFLPLSLQLLATLECLKTVDVIHTNIKPQNIMLVNRKEQSFRVKFIGFCSTFPAAEVKHGTIMQPVAYRFCLLAVFNLYFFNLIWLASTLTSPEGRQ